MSSRRHPRHLALVALGALALTTGCRAGDDREAATTSSPDVTDAAVDDADATAPPVATAAPTPPTTRDTSPPRYPDASLPIAERVDDLLARMTLSEKIGQMTLVEKNSIDDGDLAALGIGGLLSGGGGSPSENTPEAWADMVDEFQALALESRLGIPMIYGVDAVHGHSNVRGAVIFPHNIGLGAADDPELMERIGRVTAVEMAATGIYWNYAPAVSVPQDIRWGRTYEGYSEDTDRVSELAAAYLRGLQGAGLGAEATVLGTPKHFVGDGGTAWGSSTTAGYSIDQGVTDVDEATLRAVHLPPYRRVIEEGALSIMASYSSWGGEKMHAQRYLLTDVLKGELGFEGFVVSDWKAIDQITGDYTEAVALAINAGIDMNMVPSDYEAFIDALTEAVETGDVALDRIDDAVRRILRVKFELGLFERPFADRDLLDVVGSEEHRALAREAVAKSQVVLENEGLLPFPVDLPRLYVAGRWADDIGLQSGGWTIKWQGASGPITPGTTILDGIEATVSPATEVVFDAAGEFEPPVDGSPMVCLTVVGEQPYAEGAGDEEAPSLSARNDALVESMIERCDQLALVLVSGRPLLIGDHVDGVDALVAAWLPGTEGAGVADVLFGLVPATGTLPYTWPRDADQLPAPGPGDEEGPLFPYGFGL